MEIERKFLIDHLPDDIGDYPSLEYEQGYLSTAPVVRVRREGDDYVLTYKNGGMMVREEYNLPLNEASYNKLIKKAEGIIISKTRSFIPDGMGHTIELDVFHKDLAPLITAEVEFDNRMEAEAYQPPEWFGRDVTYEGIYHNSVLSREGLPEEFLSRKKENGKTEGLPDTVSLDFDDDSLVIIDQTLLPHQIRMLHLTDAVDIREAIKALKVRGAPAIGVAAAIGLYASAKRIEETDYNAFISGVRKAADIINSARPTAVNLSWAISRMLSRIDTEERFFEPQDLSDKEKKQAILDAMQNEALFIHAEDIEVCRRLGEYAEPLIKDGYGILTHCNAGHLATVRYGTATSPMYLAKNRGKNIHVYCDETRPLLQGARLTAFELDKAGIDTTLICDNMSASLMAAGKVDIIFVGTDRVAANGDVANKVGTSLLAIAAKKFGIPFYVVAPVSSIDINTPTGADIKIEQRDPDEVTKMWYEKGMAPEGIDVYNPAFDITDHELITGIITENGIINEPYTEGIRKCLK